MNKPHNSYNIVLLPPDETSQEAIRLSRLIANKFPVEFVLDGKTHYPHLTLYQLEIPDKNLSVAKKGLSDIFKLTISANFYHYWGGLHGFLSWDCSKNKGLFELHKAVIKNLNPLREDLVLPAKKLKYTFLTKQDYLQIEKFGSSGCFEYFRPHITIARFKHGNSFKKVLQILHRRKSLIVNFKKAALGRLSIHGTVTEIIEEFNLS